MGIDQFLVHQLTEKQFHKHMYLCILDQFSISTSVKIWRCSCHQFWGTSGRSKCDQYREMSASVPSNGLFLQCSRVHWWPTGLVFRWRKTPFGGEGDTCQYLQEWILIALRSPTNGMITFKFLHLGKYWMGLTLKFNSIQSNLIQWTSLPNRSSSDDYKMRGKKNVQKTVIKIEIKTSL